MEEVGCTQVLVRLPYTGDRNRHTNDFHVAPYRLAEDSHSWVGVTPGRLRHRTQREHYVSHEG